MSISSPPNYGSPDWQRGYYSAQKLLASGASPITVTLPPNCETLCVAFRTQTVNTITVIGSQSGLEYGVVGAPGGNGGAPLHIANKFYYIDVSEALDTQVTVYITNVIVGNCLVYADAGVHIVVDSSKLTNLIAEQYVVPTVPSTVAGDHPPNELQYVGSQVAASSTLVDAPGAGQRIRVFSAWITCNGTHTALINEPAARWFVACQGNGANSVTFQPTGIPLSANTAVGLVCTTGDNVGYGVSYTVETI